MSNRLDQEREKELEPKRMEYAIGQLHAAGVQSVFVVTNKSLEFDYKGNKITLWPYSGWFQGKGIKAGRGIQKLLTQLNTVK